MRLLNNPEIFSSFYRGKEKYAELKVSWKMGACQFRQLFALYMVSCHKISKMQPWLHLFKVNEK